MKTSLLALKLNLIVAAVVLSGSVAYGAAEATDNASATVYDSPGFWATGDNGGTGFNPWTLTNTGAAGFFIGSSASNAGGSSGNINSAGNESWGMFANSAGVASAVRTFTAGGSNGLSILGNGEQFILKLDNGFIDATGTVGFGLQDSAGVNRFEFFFSGGSAGYTVSGSVNQITAHGFTGDGLTATFTLTGTNSYAFNIAYNTGLPTTENFTGTLKGTVGNGIDRVRLFNANAGTTSNNDAFFNSMSVVPEPASASLIATSLLGLGFLRRRRS